MQSDLYPPRHPLSDDVVTIDGRRLHAVSVLGASLMSAFAFFAAIVFIATLTASAGFDDGVDRTIASEDLARELILVSGRIDTLSRSIDNGDIEGMRSPAGETVQMLLERRVELVKQLSNVQPGQ